MKIQGQTVQKKYHKTIMLNRPDGENLELTISPLPLGFHTRLREQGIIPPAPPTRIARDSSGRPVRDSQGMAVVVSEENDQEFQIEFEKYHQRVAVIAAAEALEGDPNIEFESKKPGSKESWVEYADELYQEFEEAGFSAGDLISLCQEICRLSNLLDDHIQENGSNFS